MVGKRLDHGWWLLLAGMFLLAFGEWARLAVPVFAMAAAEAFQFSRTLAQSLGPAGMLALLGLLLGGPLIDRHGPRRIMQAGVGLIGLGLLLVGVARSPALAALAYALSSFGFGLAFSAGPHTAIAHWFLDRRSLAMGLLIAAGLLDSLVRPLSGSITDSGAWQSIAIIAGIVLAVAGMLLSVIFRRKPAQAVTADARCPSARDGDYSLRRALGTRAFWCLAVGAAVSLSVPTLAGTFTQIRILHLLPYGLAGASRIMLWLRTLAGIFSAVLFGYLGDRHSKQNLMAVSAGLQAAGLLLSAFAGQAWQVYLSAVPASAYGVLPLLFAIRADYFGLKSFATIAVVMSAIGYLSGVPIQFALAQFLSSSTTLLLIAALLLLVAAGMFLAAKPPGVPRRSAVPGPQPAL